MYKNFLIAIFISFLTTNFYSSLTAMYAYEWTIQGCPLCNDQESFKGLLQFLRTINKRKLIIQTLQSLEQFIGRFEHEDSPSCSYCPLYFEPEKFIEFLQLLQLLDQQSIIRSLDLIECSIDNLRQINDPSRLFTVYCENLKKLIQSAKQEEALKQEALLKEQARREREAQEARAQREQESKRRQERMRQRQKAAEAKAAELYLQEQIKQAKELQRERQEQAPRQREAIRAEILRQEAERQRQGEQQKEKQARKKAEKEALRARLEQILKPYEQAVLERATFTKYASAACSLLATGVSYCLARKLQYNKRMSENIAIMSGTLGYYLPSVHFLAWSTNTAQKLAKSNPALQQFAQGITDNSHDSQAIAGIGTLVIGLPLLSINQFADLVAFKERVVMMGKGMVASAIGALVVNSSVNMHVHTIQVAVKDTFRNLCN